MGHYDKEILRIAVPSIVSNITVPLLGLVDVAITGHFGSATYLGAIAVGGMLFNVIYWMFAFLRMGTSGMTAQRRGAHDLTGVARLLVRSLSIALVLGIALLALSPLVREAALAIIAPTEEVGRLARVYFNICVFGAPASLGLFVLYGWLIGMQNSRTPMFVAIAQNVINIVASLAFVYGFGMKVEGVALGTVTAQWLGFAIAVALVWRYYGRLYQGLKASDVFSALRPDAEMARFFTVNRDIFLRTLCLITVHFFFIAAGARLGETELAVNTLLMQLFTLYSYFMDGFAFAGEALAGKAIGARSSVACKVTIKHLFFWGVGVTMLFTTVYAIGGQAFLALLTDNSHVIEAAMLYQPWTLLIPLAGMAAFVWDGVYIGATETLCMFLSTLLSMTVFFAIYITLSPTLFNHALWLAFIVYLATRGLVLTATRGRITARLQS